MLVPKTTASQDALFKCFQALNYGDLHIKRCDKTGLVAIVAIHNTSRGPALGGCRFIPYPDFNSAVIDALHLAYGMTLKAAISELPFGGGKAVLIAPKQFDRKELFLSFGRFVHELGGRYITAEDSGVFVEDMDIIREVTPFVTGHSSHHFQELDPSPLTALGVRRGIQAAIKFAQNRDELEGIHVAVKGLGKVGLHLCKELHAQGAILSIADINPTAVEIVLDSMPATVIDPEEIHKISCDVYAPCALSFALNLRTIPEIKASIIAGSANNQLESRDLGFLLAKKGILYAPDYVINAGGLIHVSAQYTKTSETEAKQKVLTIYDTLLHIFKEARKTNLPTHVIADNLALERVHTPG